MWPFRGGKKPYADDNYLANKRVKALKDFREIGAKFNYLGVTMIVTGHSYMYFDGHHFCLVPNLTADYVDNSGRVRNGSFSIHELPALLSENREEE